MRAAVSARLRAPKERRPRLCIHSYVCGTSPAMTGLVWIPLFDSHAPACTLGLGEGTMKLLQLSLLISLLGGAALANDVTELAPTGKLRAGLVFAPSLSLFFNVKEGDGTRGITTDLAAALAAKLGVAMEPALFPNSGEATDALEAGRVDVSFMPVDEARRKRIAFGPDYVVAESTYMVTETSGARTAADVDRPGMRVIGIAGTATIRLVGGMLRNTTITPVPSVQDAVAAMRDGCADAFALGRDSLPPYLKQVPGSRMTDGAFHRLPIAVAVARGKPAALAAVTDFIEGAK